MNCDNKGMFESAGQGLDNMANATKNTFSSAGASARDAIFGKPEHEKTLGDKGRDIMHHVGEKMEDAGKRIQRDAY